MVRVLKIKPFRCDISKVLTLSLPAPRWAGDNTNLPLASIVSKTVVANVVFTKKFFKEYSISFRLVCRLIGLALVVLKLLMVVELLASQRSSFSIFRVLKGLTLELSPNAMIKVAEKCAEIAQR